MYKMAAVGRFEKAAVFGLLGTETFFPETEKEAADICVRLLREDCAVIFLDEKFASAKNRISAEAAVVLIGENT